MRKVSIALVIAGMLTVIALAGCGGGGGGGSTSGGQLGGGITLTGKVLSTKDMQTPVPNVIVSIGTSAQATTGPDGHFSLNLGSTTLNGLMSEMYPVVFKVDVHNAGASYPADLKAKYLDYSPGGNAANLVWTAKAAMPVSPSILSGETTDLGTIYVSYVESDPNSPPGVPDPDQFDDTSNSGNPGDSGNPGGDGNFPPPPSF